MLALEMKKKKLLSIPVDCHIAVPDIALPPIPLALTIELNIPFNFIESENLKITRKYFLWSHKFLGAHCIDTNICIKILNAANV